MDFHSYERNELIDYDNLCDYKIFKVVFTGISRFHKVGGGGSVKSVITECEPLVLMSSFGR